MPEGAQTLYPFDAVEEFSPRNSQPYPRFCAGHPIYPSQSWQLVLQDVAGRPQDCRDRGKGAEDPNKDAKTKAVHTNLGRPAHARTRDATRRRTGQLTEVVLHGHRIQVSVNGRWGDVSDDCRLANLSLAYQCTWMNNSIEDVCDCRIPVLTQHGLPGASSYCAVNHVFHCSS